MFDNFGKVYVSIKDLAVRRIYVDPDRLLFMISEPILIFKINVFVYPPSNAVLKSAANPTKITVIRHLIENPALRPVIRRYGWTRCQYLRTHERAFIPYDTVADRRCKYI